MTPADIVEAVRTHDVNALSRARRILADPVTSRCMYCGTVLHYEAAEPGALRNRDGTPADSHGACPACMTTWEMWMDAYDYCFDPIEKGALQRIDSKWREKMAELRNARRG